MRRAVDRAISAALGPFDDGWTDAQANAEVMAAELASLGWPARAAALDWFLWQLAGKLVDDDVAAAAIERRPRGRAASASLAAFVETAHRTIAATLLKLDDDPSVVTHPHQAVVFAVSPLAVHRMAFDRWAGRVATVDLAAAWRELPGHAFLALAVDDADGAVSMLARDAFWRTVLGRQVGL